jgi:hypothetical protein
MTDDFSGIKKYLGFIDTGELLEFDMSCLKMLRYEKRDCWEYKTGITTDELLVQWLWGSTREDREATIHKLTVPGPGCVASKAISRSLRLVCPRRGELCRCQRDVRISKMRWGKVVQVLESFRNTRSSLLKCLAWMTVKEKFATTGILKPLEASHIDGSSSAFNCITRGHVIIETPTRNLRRSVHMNGSSLCDCEIVCPVPESAIQNLVAITTAKHGSSPTLTALIAEIRERYTQILPEQRHQMIYQARASITAGQESDHLQSDSLTRKTRRRSASGPKWIQWLPSSY